MKLFLFVLLLAALTSCQKQLDSQLDSPMDPHVGPTSGPWFEGWYTRITDENGKDVVGVLVGSFLPKNTSFGSGKLSGYVALFRRDVESGKLKVYEAFPERTTLTVGGRPVTVNPADETPANFEWRAEGIGSVTEESADITLEDGVSFKASYKDHEPWDKARPGYGPEGGMAHMSILKAHWFVFSLASKTEYTFSDKDGTYTGRGYGHLEKNWGNVFPRAYAWVHGSKPDGSVKIVLAGGTVPTRAQSREGWLVGYRSKKLTWNFRPRIFGRNITAKMNACDGVIQVIATSGSKKLVVKARAPRDTFSVMAVPTAEGFVSGTVQSFSTDLEIKAYQNNRLIETETIENGALEFGGRYRCQQ